MDSFTYKQIKIDFLSQQIQINEKPVKLDPKAFSTLKMLILEKHRVVNNEELIEQIWENRAISSEVIVAAIARIRKLFKLAGIEQEAIRTIHKVGYKFCLDIPLTNEDSIEKAKGYNIYKGLSIILSLIIIMFSIYIVQVPNSIKVKNGTENNTAYESVPILEKTPETKLSNNNIPTQIFFLRHAEKEYDGTDDPHLSEEGIEHAKYWNKFFKHIHFDAIYTTKFHRNLETANILAKKPTDIIRVYSALSFDISKHLPKFSGQTILIVAHSNTIPGMINSVIGKNKYEPMSLEDYQSIFKVSIDTNNNITSERYYLDWPVNTD